MWYSSVIILLPNAFHFLPRLYRADDRDRTRELKSNSLFAAFIFTRSPFPPQTFSGESGNFLMIARRRWYEEKLRDAYLAEDSNISELIKEFLYLRHEHDALMADIKELKEWHNIHSIYKIICLNNKFPSIHPLIMALVRQIWHPYKFVF
ncbi:hypothetical protein M9H77_02344 [Catharanthus roseus]|uniref:Uncharacterized protein n=1 Tax=Catharanthus roseus TaxID=4058 RepID=A0ACC0C8F3_CATRO|nr:hypothetical protein M9H77_02344 [Catharanthus roseus]